MLQHDEALPDITAMVASRHIRIIRRFATVIKVVSVVRAYWIDLNTGKTQTNIYVCVRERERRGALVPTGA